MDNYYPIEIKICSKNGWSTPQEAKGIWATPYARTGITVHWWNTPDKAGTHDQTVDYILGKAAAGVMSINYVSSNDKITLMVSPDNVAWHATAGNPTTIGIEFDPRLNDEGYKKGGWLISQLEGRYGRRLELFPHNHWFSTACPGTIDINRLRAEADKWTAGGYNPAPTPPVPVPPSAPTITISHSVLPKPVLYKLNKDANLWNYNAATWPDFKAVKSFNKGDVFAVYAIADNHNVNAKYGVTEYSYSKGLTNGINMVDLDIVTDTSQPVPTPPPAQSDPPVEPTPDPGTVITPTDPSVPTTPPTAPTEPTDPITDSTKPTPAELKQLIVTLVAALAAVIAAVASLLK